MKNLAIVGSASRSRADVNWDDKNLDIWVFNEAFQKDWCKRADGVFQMHPEAIWRNPLNRGAGNHAEVLQSGNTPNAIYMLEKYPDVPKSVKYPTREIVDALLPTLTVDSERGRKDYFTSTIAYALALGIYLGYKHIETFGVELADETEYREQLPAAMFWIGIGVGRGVEFVSHSQMFDAPLYAVESFVGLDKQIFQENARKLDAPRKEKQKEYETARDLAEIAIRKYEEAGSGLEEMTKAIWARAEAGQQFGILDGAQQENDRYFTRANAMEKVSGTYVFSRHEFSRDQTAIGVRREETIQNLNAAANQCQSIINEIKPKLFDSRRRHQFDALRKAIEIYIKYAVMVGMYTGAMNEDEKFKMEMDKAKTGGGGSSQS